MHLRAAFFEFLVFGIKEARAALFAGSFFALLFASKYLPLFGLPRYDFLFLTAIALQIVLYVTGLETKKEVQMIFLFHIIGLCLELYKTNPAIGSWSYPEPAFFKLGTVPLYSGFMYAAIGSYISQAWNIFNIRLERYPSYIWGGLLGIAIYVNFFTNHYITDIRYVLFAIVCVLFWKTHVRFKVLTKWRRLPLIVSFALIAFFIWIAENISTFLGAWQYPDQVHVWNVVSTQKITSWFLMVIISFILIAYLKHKNST